VLTDIAQHTDRIGKKKKILCNEKKQSIFLQLKLKLDNYNLGLNKSSGKIEKSR